MRSRCWAAALLVVCVCFMAFSSVTIAKTELTILVANHPAWIDYHKDALEGFEKANPDITVSILPGHITNLKINAAGNIPMDVMYLPGDTFTEAIDPGIIRELQSFIDNDKSFRLSEFFPGAVDAHRYKGVICGLPQVVSPVVLLYNKTMFDEVGMPYPTTNWNWDTVVNNGRKLTIDRDNDGHPDQYAWSYHSWTLYNRWPMFVWQNGGDVFNQDGTKMILDRPEAVEAIKYYGDLAMLHDIAPLPRNRIMYGASYTQLFNDNKLAMATQTRYYKPPDTVDYDITHVPMGKTRATTLITNYYGILSTSKHPNEAWRLVRYLLTVPTIKEKLDKAAPAIPAYRPNAVALIRAEINAPRKEAVWLEALEYARGPYYPPVSGFVSLVEKHFNNYATGTLPAQTMAEQFTQEVNALLAKR